MGRITNALNHLAAGEFRSALHELRAHPSSNETNWSAIFGGQESASGINVTPETSLQATAVHACVSVIAGTVATLPLHIYRRQGGGGKERATDHPLYSILHDAPNDLLTSVEFREMMQAHLCLRGNAYARVVRNGSGAVAYLDPIHPDRVSIFRSGLTATYSVQLQDGGQEVLRPDQILHIRGLGPDGLLGYSPISLARDAVGLSIATERHGAKFFANGARPSGVLETPNTLKDDQLKALREHWEKMHAGVNNSNRLAVLSGGMKYAGITMSMEDAQFLETRQYQVDDIARIFRVPPHKIGSLRNATFSNIEHQAIEFVTDCIRPWAVRWEQRMNQVLLTPTERKTYFIELSLDGLLRGDMKTRYEAYQIGRNGGWLSSNDVRELENMNRIEGGDTYMQPLNMSALGDFQPQQKQAA